MTIDETNRTQPIKSSWKILWRIVFSWTPALFSRNHRPDNIERDNQSIEKVDAARVAWQEESLQSWDQKQRYEISGRSGIVHPWYLVWCRKYLDHQPLFLGSQNKIAAYDILLYWWLRFLHSTTGPDQPIKCLDTAGTRQETRHSFHGAKVMFGAL